MKTVDEIKQRKLDLYDSREKIQEAIDKSNDLIPTLHNDIVRASHNTIIAFYNALISQLDWVLNEKK